MPAATSPRKRALMPSGVLRRRLRAAGHRLTPVVQIGKSGITAQIGKQVAAALDHHELIKIKIGSECPVDRYTVADDLAALPRAHVAQIVGRVILLYRRHPDHGRFENESDNVASSGGEQPPVNR